MNISNEDNMILMSRYPDNHFELAIVDPPYGIGQGGKKINSKTQKKDGSLIYKKDRRNGKQIIVKPKKYHNKYSDDKPPDQIYFDELIRVSKNQIIWGANHFISKIPYDSSCWIVWDKVNGETDQSDCELAWTSFKTAVRQVEFMWNGFTQGKSIKEGRTNQGDKSLCEIRNHPNQKPVKLYEWLLLNYAKPGDKILDTHLGSGSIAIACHNLKYDLTACELDKDYYDAGVKRLEAHQKQYIADFDIDVNEPEQTTLEL